MEVRGNISSHGGARRSRKKPVSSRNWEDGRREVVESGAEVELRNLDTKVEGGSLLIRQISSEHLLRIRCHTSNNTGRILKVILGFVKGTRDST